MPYCGSEYIYVMRFGVWFDFLVVGHFCFGNLSPEPWPHFLQDAPGFLSRCVKCTKTHLSALEPLMPTLTHHRNMARPRAECIRMTPPTAHRVLRKKLPAISPLGWEPPAFPHQFLGECTCFICFPVHIRNPATTISGENVLLA